MSGSRRTARNVLVTLGTQLASWALTFAVTMYLPRYVGDVGLGKLAFAASFVALFGVFVPLGTSSVLVKELARAPERAGELLTAAILIRIPLGIVTTLVAVGSVWLLGYEDVTRTLVIVSAIGILMGTVNDAFGAALQGLENFPRQNLAVIVDKFLSSGLTIFLVLRRAPLWMLAAVALVTGAASLAVNISAFGSHLKDMRLPSLRTVRALAVAGLPFMGWTVFRTLYGQTDPVVLSLITNDATVGWYAAAFRLVGTTLFLPGAITTALLPTLARLYREDDGQFQRLARRMFSLIMLCGVPIALVLICLPERLIALMHYPAAFIGSVPVIRVGGVGVLLYFAACVLGTTVIAADGQGRMFRASVVACCVGVPACFLASAASQRFWGNGAVGAMVSDVLLEVYLLWSYLRILPEGTFGTESLSLLARCLVAALAIPPILTVPIWGDHPGLWPFLPATIIYAALCWLLRCFDPGYITLLRGALARKTVAATEAGA